MLFWKYLECFLLIDLNIMKVRLKVESEMLIIVVREIINITSFSFKLKKSL